MHYFHFFFFFSSEIRIRYSRSCHLSKIVVSFISCVQTKHRLLIIDKNWNLLIEKQCQNVFETFFVSDTRHFSNIATQQWWLLDLRTFISLRNHPAASFFTRVENKCPLFFVYVGLVGLSLEERQPPIRDIEILELLRVRTHFCFLFALLHCSCLFSEIERKS